MLGWVHAECKRIFFFQKWYFEAFQYSWWVHFAKSKDGGCVGSDSSSSTMQNPLAL